MLTLSNQEEENRIINELINSNDELYMQHILFEAEMRFKQELIDARKSKSLTQKEISSRTGLSQQAISRLEKGQGGTIETVIKYLHAMGLTLAVKDA